MKLTYYPGCSLESTGQPYDKSFRAVCGTIGIELKEIEDWNCCGTTSYQAVDRVKALAIASRNIGIAEKYGNDIVAPCSSCYLVLKKALKAWKTEPDIKEVIDGALAEIGLEITGNVKVKHGLEVLTDPAVMEKIKSAVKKPLKGWKIAPYYGCQVARPFTELDDPEYPEKMDELLRILGAEVVPYAMKTKCCGGALIATSEKDALDLIKPLFECAKQSGAGSLVTVCPLCLLNLDAYQKKVNDTFNTDYVLPVFYVSELVGLALGLDPGKLGLKQHFVSNKALVENLT